MADIDSTVQEIVGKLGALIDDLLTLTVTTKIAQFGDDGNPLGGDPVTIASTEIKLEGDATYVIPAKGEVPISALNDLHKGHVEAAKEFRLSQIKALADVIRALQGQASS